MTNTVKILTAVATIILMASFTGRNTHDFIGTYGVSSSDPSQIKLTIHSNHTFYYQDFSVSDKKIVIEGTWTLEDNKVVLIDDKATEKFHNVWSFDENGQIAKSRKGLTFYRLCKMNA